jgi:sugar O-acyltransferase (sialic acid O-acetyltransferase NeuD family)
MIIIGAGWHGRELAKICADCDYKVEGFLDDKVTGMVDGIPVVGPTYSFEPLIRINESFVLGIGDNDKRRAIGEALYHSNASLPIIIHPTAVVWSKEIDCGTVIFPFAMVSVAAKIGKFCIINKHATVGHGAELADGCNIADTTVLSGKMGEGSFMGLHAVAIPGVNIGARATIGAGAVVIKDVPDGQTWVGVPAKPSGLGL